MPVIMPLMNTKNNIDSHHTLSTTTPHMTQHVFVSRPVAEPEARQSTSPGSLRISVILFELYVDLILRHTSC